jgi:hypothetical protein
MNERPTAVIIKRRPNGDNPAYDVVEVQCPYCGKRHAHGVKVSEGPNHGHRVADCPAIGGYSVCDPPGRFIVA